MKKNITESTSHNIIDETRSWGKVEKKTGKRIGYNYIILKSLKESQKNDVVKCLYIKSLTKFGICVIKEGCHGDTKDAQGREIKDRLLWQKLLHQELQSKVRMPRLIDTFEENENLYLVIEYIKGKSFYKACKEKQPELREGLITGNKIGIAFLDYLIQILSILESLHENHLVHRDATANNFIVTPGGKIFVIDMELSYSLQKELPDPPFRLGTYGYMSPEQEATMSPTIKEDVYSVGAIILYMLTGISPSKLTTGNYQNLTRRVNFFVPDKGIADLVLKSLHTHPGNRPELNEIIDNIKVYKSDLRKKIIRQQSKREYYCKDDVLALTKDAINTLSTPLLSDPDKGWFAADIQQPSNPDTHKINKVWYASYNRGVSGIIYMLSQARKVGLDINSVLPSVDKGIKLIKEKYINKIEKAVPGLHFGADGVAASLASALLTKLVDPTHECKQWIDQLLGKETKIISVKDGVAGQGLAYMICMPFLPLEEGRQRLDNCAENIISLQQSNGSWVTSGNLNRKRTTKGFLNGIAGVIYFLLQYSALYKDYRVLEHVERGLQWLIKKAVRTGDCIQWKSSKGKSIAPWWCEGAPGIAFTFLYAYKITGNFRYKQYAIDALHTENKEVIANNLSQCYGLSGLGEIYLEAFRILGDDQWLKRAEWIVQEIMQLKQQDNQYGPFWIVEQERQPVPGFMIGNSGLIHFLLRYCYNEQLNFPMTCA